MSRRPSELSIPNFNDHSMVHYVFSAFACLICAVWLMLTISARQSHLVYVKK